jgi:hypothetical protein
MPVISSRKSLALASALCCLAVSNGQAAASDSLTITSGINSSASYLRSLGCKLVNGNYKYVSHSTTGPAACLARSGKVHYKVGHQCHRYAANQIDCVWFWSEWVTVDWCAYVGTSTIRSKGKTKVQLTSDIFWRYEPATGY